MRLFTFATSPYARKVRMVLEYKRVPYETVERCYSIDRKEDLRRATTRAEVPALVIDDGRTIADSTIICEYLEEAHPTPPLFPSDLFERARMRSLEDLCDRTFDAVAYGYWVALMRTEAPESESMKKAAAVEFEALLRVLERELYDREFLCGSLSVADLTAICYVPSAPMMGIQLSQFSALSSWIERMRALPVVRCDIERFAKAMSEVHDIKSELEGPDGRVHWRDSRLEWPIRHGFLDFVVREFKARKMMFPPDAS